MEVFQVSYEVNKLEDIVEERNRLVSSLDIQPSANDNVKLKTQLDKIVEVLNGILEKATGGDLTESDSEAVQEQITQYNKLVNSLDDDVIEKSIYLFTKKLEVSQQDESVKKTVRFNDELAYNKAPTSESMQFKPYFDDEEEQVANTAPQGYSDDPLTSTVSNQEIFIEQQQRLMEQDTNIDSLSESVQRSHGISLDINREVTEQNEHVLGDLENLIESSGRNLNRAKRRLHIFQRTARENGPCSLIVLLTLILIFLLVVL